jgi:plasmid maintenance system killer protein
MKLQQLHAAEDLKDLLIPVSNQLEALKGDRKGERTGWAKKLAMKPCSTSRPCPRRRL